MASSRACALTRPKSCLRWGARLPRRMNGPRANARLCCRGYVPHHPYEPSLFQPRDKMKRMRCSFRRVASRLSAFLTHRCRRKRATDSMIEQKPGIAEGFECRLGDEADLLETFEQFAPHAYAITLRMGGWLVEVLRGHVAGILANDQASQRVGHPSLLDVPTIPWVRRRVATVGHGHL